MDDHQTLAAEARRLAQLLPDATMHAVAAALADSTPQKVDSALRRSVPHHHHREAASRFAKAWHESGLPLTAAAVTVASAASLLHDRRHEESIEVVWTGPDAEGTPARRTQEAILQLINSAENTLTLVSFAVYRIPRIAVAIADAAARGVRLRVIVETPHENEGGNEYNTIRALGDEVASCSEIYYWPVDSRQRSERGVAGLLHVKCAVADRQSLLVTSANLTDQAFTINMELGLLVTGGDAPSAVENRLTALVQSGVLRPIRR